MTFFFYKQTDSNLLRQTACFLCLINVQHDVLCFIFIYVWFYMKAELHYLSLLFIVPHERTIWTQIAYNRTEFIVKKNTHWFRSLSLSSLNNLYHNMLWHKVCFKNQRGIWWALSKMNLFIKRERERERVQKPDLLMWARLAYSGLHIICKLSSSRRATP